MQWKGKINEQIKKRRQERKKDNERFVKEGRKEEINEKIKKEGRNEERKKLIVKKKDEKTKIRKISDKENW